MNSYANLTILHDIVCDGQHILIVMELSLVLGVIWLIFKKKKNQDDLLLTESEKEKIIFNYEPESLAEEIPDTHQGLNSRMVEGKPGMYITINGIRCLNFGTNDYLGFIGNKKIEDKSKESIETYGVGSCGPRGFYGTSVEHLQLEKLLAQFLEGEDSLVYSYGFATVSSAIPAYAKKTDIIFADEKRNFAIEQGLVASKSIIKYFKHNNMNDLEQILETVKANDRQNMRKARKSRRYLVVEGIYINTGEICPLPDLVRLSKKYKLRIFIDESISFGILGKTGRGVTEYFGIPRKDIDLIMGSFEYVLASVGGFCVGSRFLIDHQQISGQGYCFSASLPTLLVTAALEALINIKDNSNILVKLNTSCKIMHCQLQVSTIINNYFVVTGNEDSPVHVLTLQKKFLLEHWDANDVIESIIQYCIQKKVAVIQVAFLPKVDKVVTEARLRITTSVFHKQEHIMHLISTLEEACTKAFID